MEKEELYYQLALHQLEEQSRRNREIQTKATGLLGLSATLVAVAVFTLRLTPDVAWWPFLALALVGVGFAAVSGFCISILRAREWRGYPNLDDYTTIMETYDVLGMIEAAGDSMHESYKYNDRVITRKADNFNRAIAALGFQVVMLMALGALAAI